MVDPYVPIPYKVRELEQENESTVTLHLTSKFGSKDQRFLPGQFNMIYAFAIGEVAISMSGDSARRDILTHTIRGVGAVTEALVRLKKGSTVGVRGPYGTSWPIERAERRDVLLIAGGIGLAPLRPAVLQLLSERERFGKIALLYGARSSKDLIYVDDLRRWRGSFDMQVEVTVDSSSPEWRGNVGVVPSLINKVEFSPGNTLALICGPEVMMRFTVLELVRRGVADNDIYLSLERNMKCAVGFCGHCQYREYFICKDGPIFSFDQIKQNFGKREL